MPRKSTKLHESRSKTEETDWYASPEGRRQNAARIRTGAERRHAGSLLWIAHTADESRHSQSAAGTSESECHPPRVDSPVRRRYRACERHCIQAGDRLPDRAQRSDTLWPEAGRLGHPEAARSILYPTSVKLI